jgi:hypothetical protein
MDMGSNPDPNPKTQKKQAPNPNPKTQRKQVPNPNQNPITQNYLGLKKNPKKNIFKTQKFLGFLVWVWNLVSLCFWIWNLVSLGFWLWNFFFGGFWAWIWV